MLRRPVKTINKQIQKHFEAWQNMGLADVMQESKKLNQQRKKTAMAASNRLYSLHAQNMKKRDQKMNEKRMQEGTVEVPGSASGDQSGTGRAESAQDQQGGNIVAAEKPSTFMTDTVRKRSKLEQEQYELQQQTLNATSSALNPLSCGSKKQKLKDQHESLWGGTDFGAMFVKKKSRLELEKEAFLERQREQKEKSLIDIQKRQQDIVQKID